MKKIIAAFVWILIFLNFYYIEPSHAQKKTFTCTVKQSYGGSLRLPFDTALIFANAKARRKVQKKAAVYWKSLLVGKNREVSMAELIALVKGIFQKETSLKTKNPLQMVTELQFLQRLNMMIALLKVEFGSSTKIISCLIDSWKVSNVKKN